MARSGKRRNDIGSEMERKSEACRGIGRQAYIPAEKEPRSLIKRFARRTRWRCFKLPGLEA
jgi:hypothetical protein